MYLQKAKCQKKTKARGRGKRDRDSGQPGVTSANEKLILLEILNVCTRGLVL